MGKKRNFLYGRNGSDAISKAANIVACLLLVIDMLADSSAGVLWFVALGLLVYSYFRIFSKNVYKRKMENRWFLNKLQPLIRFRVRWAERKRLRNLYCFFKCPQCSTVLRVPKGKGRIRITCRCCQHVFERIS